MQRQLNESINVSTNMDINDKSDLGSSELTVLISNCQGKRVTRSSGKDKNGKDDTSYGADGGWKIEEEIKYTRRSPFEDKDEEEEEEEEEEAASDCKEEEENEMNGFLSKEGKGIMLCMPVTEVSHLPYVRYLFTCAHYMLTKQVFFTFSWKQVQQQLEPPSHDHDKPIGQEEQEDDELEIHARRLRRYRSREQTTNRSSRSRSLDNERRPDPEGFSCKDYSRQASTQHQHNGKLSVKKTSRPTAHRQKEPEEKDHTQRRPRRSRRSSDTKHIARSSSFTYGGNGHQVPPPPPPLKSEQHSTTSPPKRHNSAPDFQQLLESVATQKSKVSNDRVNKAVNPRQDDDTLSTAASSTVPQSPIKDSQILRHPQLPDVKESPPSMTTDGNVISSYLPCEEVNLNNYDKRGFCVVHPHIRLRKKKFFKRLSLSLQLNCMDPNGIGVSWSGPGSSSDEYNDPEEDGWKILTSVCPECCTNELRRTQLALAAIQRQQQMCQSVETNSVTEHQQQATASLDRVCTLDMLSRLPSQGRS